MGVYYFLKYTFCVFTRIVWIGKVEGTRNVPKRGRILIAPNHQSWIDCFFVATVLSRRLYFLVGEFLYDNKMFAWGMNQMGLIKVDRKATDKQDVYEKSHALLNEDKALVIFPEGKMTKTGMTQRAYKGVAKMALATETDIVPTVIESYHVYPVHNKWPRFDRRVRIKFLKPLRYADFKNMDPGVIVHELLMPEIARELGHEYPSE